MQLTIQDVHRRLFANADSCDVSMVYIDQNMNDKTIHTLKVKRFADGCHVFFTSKGDYYYFYNSLLHRLILWSRHPRAFGKEGYDGSHTTIGFNQNTKRWDIHDTRYHYKNSTVGTFRIIAPECTERTYHRQQGGRLPQQAPEHVKWLWDQMWCDENTQAGGADEGLTKLLKTTPQQTRPMTMADMKKRCQPVYKAKVHGVVRLSYVPKHRMLEVADGLKREGYNQVLVSHHRSRSTFVWISVV